MTERFIKFKPTHTSEWLLLHKPCAFLLLTYIAHHARFHPDILDGLHPGDSIISYKCCGITRQQYRDSKDYLVQEKYIEIVWNPKNKVHQKRTIKRTIKGEVANLINSDIYDLNLKSENHQKDHQRTIKEPQTKNDKKEKESSSHLNKEMKGIKKIIPFPDSKDQEALETILEYAASRELPLSEASVARWMKDFKPELVHATIGDFIEKADKVKYKDKEEAWIQSALNRKTNVLKNKEFIESFKLANNWQMLTLNKSYCKDETTGNDYKYNTPHEQFRESIIKKFEQKKENQ